MIEAAFNFNNYGSNYLLGQDLTGINGVDVIILVMGLAFPEFLVVQIL